MKLKKRSEHSHIREIERRVERALRMYEVRDEAGKRKYSIRIAAELNGLKPGRLRLRILGGKNRVEAHQHQQLLNKSQEKSIIRWVEELEDAGFPPRLRHVREAATLLCGKKPGKNWLTRFLNRHAALAKKFTTPIEKRRRDAATPKTIQDHFTKLQRVISTFQIKPENIFNMDEKGFLLGLAQRSKVICRFQKGSVRAAEDGNRELVTSIECVSAAGVVLPPLIIYKGTNHYMGWHRFTTADTAGDFRFSYSEKGWTNRALGLQWLKEVFDPYSAGRSARAGAGAAGKRLLIVDGHNSHDSIAFLEYAIAHDILIYCLPSHCTHLLQPLDVALFHPLQSYYSEEMHRYMSSGGIAIAKSNFLPFYTKARDQAYKKISILNAFKACGIMPLNPRVVMQKIPGTDEHGRTTVSSMQADTSDELKTPKSGRELSRLARQKKLEIQQETDMEALRELALGLLDKLVNFGLGEECDKELLRKRYRELQEAQELNPKTDRRQLGSQLARVLDGREIQRLYQARQARDEKGKARAGRTDNDNDNDATPAGRSLPETPLRQLPKRGVRTVTFVISDDSQEEESEELEQSEDDDDDDSSGSSIGSTIHVRDTPSRPPPPSTPPLNLRQVAFHPPRRPILVPSPSKRVLRTRRS